MVYIIINYIDEGDSSKNRQKAFEIRTNTRWLDSDIMKIVKEFSDDGINGNLVKIREGSDRVYLWFNHHQFTGNRI